MFGTITDAEITSFVNSIDCPPQSERVTRLSYARPWVRDALRKIAELTKLPDNWDGYGSRPIQPKAHQQATVLIEQLGKSNMPGPQIFPVPGGGLQLEWQNDKCGAELEILPDGSMQYLIEDEAGEMREGAVAPSLTEVYRLFRWFDHQETTIVTF